MKPEGFPIAIIKPHTSAVKLAIASCTPVNVPSVIMDEKKLFIIYNRSSLLCFYAPV